MSIMHRVLLPSLLLSSLVFAASSSDKTNSDSGPLFLEQNIRTPEQSKTTRADIRIDVTMTLVPVTVTDPMGRTVTGLRQENFRVIDGSEARPIIAFSQQDAPVSVGLVFDCSGSMKDKYKTARLAPAELFKQLNADDESFLVTVSDHPALRQPFTSKFSDIESSLMFVNPRGTTSLIDGVFLALNQMKKAHNPKKAIVVVSDGGDNNSRYSLRELLKRAVESDTQIYTIGLFNDPRTQEEVNGPQILSDIAAKSGGQQYSIHDPAALAGAMSQIGITLHNQYVLGYYPPDDAQAGKYRKIKVQVLVPGDLPPLQIYARSSYYVPER
jgi:Ca-activated chloride channel family protein